MRRIRETRGGVHWQTANGFLLVELSSEIAQVPAKSRAFVRDVEAFAAIFRPDIARVVDWTSAGEFTYVVLEVPAGATLRELADKTRVPPDVRARIVLDTLEAVEVAHANGAVFGDLDADSVVITERGQVVLLPTCSRARAATPEDDITAVARLAGIQDAPQTAPSLGNRLRALGAVAQRETVSRFVTRVALGNEIPQPPATSQAPPRRPTAPPPLRTPYAPKPPPPLAHPPRSSADSFDEVTRVIPLDGSRAIYELSPDDLIPVGVSEPDIPIYIEEPPDPRDTERPVVSEPEIVVDFRRAPGRKRRGVAVMLIAVLVAACAIAAPIWWPDATTWLRAAGLIPNRAPRPAPAVEQQAPAAQPPPVSMAQRPATPTSSATAEATQVDAAPPPETPAPAKRRAAPRRAAKRAAEPSPETDEAPKSLESSPSRFVPSEP